MIPNSEHPENALFKVGAIGVRARCPLFLPLAVPRIVRASSGVFSGLFLTPVTPVAPSGKNYFDVLRGKLKWG